MATMTTSSAGRAALRADEGEVLTAYPDVKGVWTIGVGLTAASGLITPKRGMTITRAQSDDLFARALREKYEPAVRSMLPNVPQHVFDGSVSFHYNTGAIRTASWVKSYLAGDRDQVRARLSLWNKSGGKVIRGLTLRRAREADLILEGVYPHGIKPDVVPATPPPVSIQEPLKVLRQGSKGEAVTELQRKLQTLGLYEGSLDADFGPKTEKAVRAFQKMHPILTVDGKAGPATLSQLQRVMDAKSSAVAYGAFSAGAAAVGIGTLPIWAGVTVAALGAGLIGWNVWKYRDEWKAMAA